MAQDLRGRKQQAKFNLWEGVDPSTASPPLLWRFQLGWNHGPHDRAVQSPQAEDTQSQDHQQPLDRTEEADDHC